MNEKPQGIRQEHKEAYLSNIKLLNVWETEVAKTEQKLNSPELNDLVDVVRSSGLRATLGRERDKKFLRGDFRHWTRRWSYLKSRALVEAIWRRGKRDTRILIAYSIDDEQLKNYRERLTFVFLIEPKPYRTSTALSNLTRIISKEYLMASLGQSDQLPTLQ